MMVALQWSVLIWLSVCAAFDWRTRRVSNWLTLPPLALAFVLRLAGMVNGVGLLLVLIVVVVLVGWWVGSIGGADVKIILALALLSPGLALWAWMGVACWWLLARLVTMAFLYNSTVPLRKLPGAMGMLLGVLARFTILF